MQSSTQFQAAILAEMPGWLITFVNESIKENETLTENGAESAVTARIALLSRLISAAQTYLNAELNIDQAAELAGCHPETVRRAVRTGAIPDLRKNPRGHHRIRRGDLDKLVGHRLGRYDPGADAQDIANQRRPR
ncbi:MAG: helix-turn-helix domain-containing protein [Gemmatimonadales bacterium]|nr:helix-turn-helix domain-containing protein [Gemmatimonadales bacterium]